MTIVLLASVYLLALVVATACRPILSDSDLGDRVPTLSTVQTAVQAAFHVHPGNDDPEPDAVRIHSQDTKHQSVYVSELKAEDIPTIASLETSLGIKPLSEGLSREVGRNNVLDANNELDVFQADHIDKEQAVTGPLAVNPISGPPTAPFVCAVGFLALACIALMLYIINALRSNIIALNAVWELLSRFWRHPMPQEHVNETDKKLRIADVGPQFLLAAEEGSAEMHPWNAATKPLYLDVSSDTESEWDDADEKYEDALDMTPLLPPHDLPLEEQVPHQSRSELPSGFRLLDSQTDDPSPQMRGLCSSSLSRPAWSVRTVDSPPLGLSSRETGLEPTLQPLIHPRRRAYRSVVPEFDIALAMQLRPGLGVGADSAWMVRFLMTIFGWFAVALTGNTR